MQLFNRYLVIQVSQQVGDGCIFSRLRNERKLTIIFAPQRKEYVSSGTLTNSPISYRGEFVNVVVVIHY